MDSLLAISFDDSVTPYEALTSLEQLQEQGRIKVLEGAVVERDGAGRLLIRDDAKSRTAPGSVAARGGLVGVLMGIIGGPVGVLIGGTVGTLIGASLDLSPQDEDEGPLAQYSRHIGVGQTAVLAHLEEPTEEIVDAAMLNLNGRILRQPIDFVRAEMLAAGDRSDTEGMPAEGQLTRSPPAQSQ
jgi:uncharacterized membrane protein